MKTIIEKKNLCRPCPVCQNALNGKVLHTQKFVLSDNHLLPKEYDLVSCDQCGTVYADTSVGQDVYDRYYAEISKYDMDHSRNDTLWYADAAVLLDAIILDKNASILEVGCGSGRLLFELKKIGFLNLTALDPSQKCIDMIQRQSIQGISSSIFEVPCTQSYDVVILQGVLEHIYDVFRLMQILTKLTKPNGIILLGVPDASRYQDYDTVPYDYLNIEHINHFDEASLINLGFIHGLSVFRLFQTTLTFAQTTQPVIFCVYKQGEKKAASWEGVTQKSVLNYLEKTSKNKMTDSIIDTLVKGQEEIIVWGAGNYTSRLLATSRLGECNIAMFVDKDANKQGTSIIGRPVYAPDAILKMKTTSKILVAAAVYDGEILGEIKKMGIDNKVVVLK